MPPRRRFPAPGMVWWLLVSSLPGAASAAPQEMARFGTTVVIPSGLKGQVYFLREGESWLPDFSRLKPVGTLYTTTLGVEPQSWSLGFPGITNRYEWFAIDYRGRFWIEKPGRYEFSLTSDDGAKLYIDDRTIINLDGTHPPETAFGHASLECGIHWIRVSYFQGPRDYLALYLTVSGGATKKWRLFSTEEFKPPPNPENWRCGPDGTPVPFDPGGVGVAAVAAPPFEKELMAALEFRPAPKAFPVRSALYRFRQTVSGTQTAMAFAVAGSDLKAAEMKERAGFRRVHVAMLTLTKLGGGPVFDQHIRDAPFEVPESKLAAVQSKDVVFTRTLTLPAGHSSVEAAVLDRESGRMSVTTMPIDAAAPQSGLGLSTIVAAESVEAAGEDPEDPFVFAGKRVVPSLASAFNSGQSAFAYFVVYPNASNGSKPALRAQFLVDGKVVADHTAELPVPDATGAIPMVVGLAMMPGSCELRVTVTQGAESRAESVRYQVAGP